MISKFAKKQTKFIANRIFTDRINPSKVFSDSICALSSKPQEIIVYYGKGGIGKTRLLQQLIKNSDQVYSSSNKYSFHNIFMSFDAREVNNEIDIMMNLRNKLHGDGGLFDYAVINYWAKAKFTLDEIMNKNTTLSHNIHRVLEDVIALGSSAMTIPVFVLNETRDLIRDDFLQSEYGEVIDEIHTLTEAELFERLPFYLGLCFSSAAQKGDVHVFFFDAYERLQNGSQSVEWFMEFLASCEILRACIASRDKLRWSLENDGWDDVLNQHLLDNLSDEDSRWFLEQVPVVGEDIIANIVKHSGGVPLFLDMSVDLYQDDMNNNRTPDFSKIKHGEKLIDRYMNYLDSDSTYAVKILSIPDCFNTELALYLLEARSVHMNEEQLQELFKKSIVLSVDAGEDMWKIDRSVRMHLRDQMPKEKISAILSDILTYIKEKSDAKAFLYFTSVLNTVKRDPQSIIGLNEAIIEQIDYYGNSGFWLELDKILADCSESENINLRAISTMSKIIYIRRVGSLKDEESFISAHPLDEETLGNYYFMYAYHKIQCRHLQGYYDEALEKYRRLLDKMNLIRQAIPPHIYNTVCMKYADLLFLKGKFTESLEITEELLNGSNLPLVDQIELMRIKGHIFKFQRKFEEAKIIYLTALKLAQKQNLSAYLGKLMTNMAEVEAFINPQESVSWFEKSRLINEKNGNLIELGKAYSACAVANACLIKQRAEAGCSKDAEKYTYDALGFANQAISLSKQAGYRSGEAFALVGLALAHKNGGNTQEYTVAVKRLETLLSELNVYTYLLDLVK